MLKCNGHHKTLIRYTGCWSHKKEVCWGWCRGKGLWLTRIVQVIDIALLFVQDLGRGLKELLAYTGNVEEDLCQTFQVRSITNILNWNVCMHWIGLFHLSINRSRTRPLERWSLTTWNQMEATSLSPTKIVKVNNPYLLRRTSCDRMVSRPS